MDVLPPLTLITGTRKGIGKYLVEHYVKEGHRVVGCSRKFPDWSLKGYSHHLVNVSAEEEVKVFFAEIRRKHGRLDNLINNAGVASMNHVLLTPVSTVEKILNTNVIGTFLFCREAAKLMKTAEYGRIVNFSTVAVPLKLNGEAVYAASKAAIVSLTEVLSRELADWGITVNAVGPAPARTDLIRNVPPDKIGRILDRQAIRRFARGEDIANVIDFYLRRESDFITGQTIYLGGV